MAPVIVSLQGHRLTKGFAVSIELDLNLTLDVTYLIVLVIPDLANLKFVTLGFCSGW